MMDWKPIETAPKDGRKVLIRDADEAVCEEAWWDGFMWGTDEFVFTSVTHWKPAPLPSPPLGEE